MSRPYVWDLHGSGATDAQAIRWSDALTRWVPADDPASYSDPLTTKGDLVGRSSSATGRVPVGANGRVLAADSTQTFGIAWTDLSGLYVPLSTVTTKGDLIAATGSGAVARRSAGSDGQALVADSAQTTGLNWSSVATDPTTTKGDLLARTASALARLAVGSDGQVLTADAASTNGVKWAPTAGSAALTYRQLVLLENPWFYLMQEETSGTVLRGESGMVANDATITGSPTLNQTGPKAGKAISWPSSASTEAYAGSAAKQSSLTITSMGWVYLTGTPTAITPIVGFAESYNNASRDKTLYVGTDGKLKWHIFTGSDSTLSSASALSLNTWHFCVGVVGQLGQFLYLDGALEASGAGQSTFVGSGQFAFVHGGGTTWTDGSAALIAEPAVFLKEVKASVISALYAA